MNKIRNEYTLFQFRQSVTVIPCLTREPAVFIHVDELRVLTSGSRIKSGMTVTDCLDWMRVFMLNEGVS